MRNAIIPFTSLALAALLNGAQAHAQWENKSIQVNSESAYRVIGAASADRAVVVGFEKIGDSLPVPTASYTKDGGATWNLAVSYVVPSSIHFIDERTGFLGPMSAFPVRDQEIAGCLHRTDDGGVTWEPVLEAEFTKAPLFDPEDVVEIFSSRDGEEIFAIGATGRIVISRDRGTTWKKIRLWTDMISSGKPSGTWLDLTAGVMVGDHIWLVGGDQGEAAQPSDDPFAEEEGGRPGGDGFVVHSGDRGRSFELLASGLPYYAMDVSFIDEDTGWIAGGTYRSGGAATAYTSDGGRSWTEVPMGSLPEDEVITGPQFLYPVVLDSRLSVCPAIRMFGAEVGLAICTTTVHGLGGFNGLYLTEDGGRSWEHQSSFNKGYKPALRANPVAAAAQILDSAVVDCNTVWATGSNLLVHRFTAESPIADCGPGIDDGDDSNDGETAGDDGARASDACGCRAVGEGRGSFLSSLLHLIW